MTIDRVLVVGAGAMGAQIALLGALGGMSVHLHDVRAEGLLNAEQSLRSRLARRVAKGDMSQEEMDAAFARLVFTGDLAAGAVDAQLVIEAIIEDLEAKVELFRSLSALVTDACIFASNSSSIVASILGERSDRPDRVCNMHFFNPPLVMECVEVVARDGLAPDVIPAVLDVCRRMGRSPVRLDREIPGFVANRIVSAVVAEAAAMVEGGYASVEAVDEICRTALRYPMGPFELLDMAGLDVNRQMQQLIFEQTGDQRDQPVAAVTRLVDQGRLGRKSGAGFYDYTETTGGAA